jgi:predicted DsbA family dithiol-disulfide isomerase
MSDEWKIDAIADDGEQVTIEEHKDGLLHRLLTEAVHKLYGEDKKVDEYEILIDGTVQTNLDVSLVQAGLHDGSEVVVQPKDVSRG